MGLGVWEDNKRNNYIVELHNGALVCARRGPSAREASVVRFTIEFCEEDELYWWGLEKKYYLDPEELRKEPDKASWYSPNEDDFFTGTEKARFVWTKISDGEAAP